MGNKHWLISIKLQFNFNYKFELNLLSYNSFKIFFFYNSTPIAIQLKFNSNSIRLLLKFGKIQGGKIKLIKLQFLLKLHLIKFKKKKLQVAKRARYSAR